MEDNPDQVREKLEQGCECQISCFHNLDPESVYKHRLNIAELTKAEHEMYLMGVTMASLANRNETSRHKERIRQRASYVYQGRKVCLYAFCYLEHVTNYQLKRIRNHVLTHGVIPRIHGNKNRKPHNTFSLDLYKRVENFLRSYLDLPASNKPTPTDKSKSTIYKAYKMFEMSENSEKIMGYSTFRHFMQKQFPHVKFVPKTEPGKPGADQSLKKTIKIDPDEEATIEEYLEDSDVEYHVVVDNENVGMTATIGEDGEIIYTATGDEGEQLIYYENE